MHYINYSKNSSHPSILRAMKVITIIFSGYLENNYFGSTIGRFANRICKGHFKLDAKEYQLNCNNGENHLHGGIKAWDKVYSCFRVANQSFCLLIKRFYYAVIIQTATEKC